MIDWFSATKQILVPLKKNDVNYPIIGFAVINKSLEPLSEKLNHLGPVQNQRNEQKPGVEPQLLEPNAEILLPESFGTGIGPLKVVPAKNGLVEDVGLDEEPGLAGPHVLAEVELADPARDLADFPAVQTGLDELGPFLLLVLPEAHVGLEDLVEVVLVVDTSVRWHVANPSELPVRALHQRSESPRNDIVVGHVAS